MLKQITMGILFLFFQKQHRIIENCIWISRETIEILVCQIHSLVAKCRIRFTDDCKQTEDRTLAIKIRRRERMN